MKLLCAKHHASKQKALHLPDERRYCIPCVDVLLEEELEFPIGAWMLEICLKYTLIIVIDDVNARVTNWR
jgi:hypothetical protein